MSREVQAMFSSIAKRYDRANDVLSLGIHHLWRGAAVRFAEISKGQVVLDLCCGTGDFSFAAAQAVGPSGKVLGLDFVFEMIELAKKKKRLADGNFSNVAFFQGDALSIPLPDNSVDVVTISFGIRNVDNTLECLADIARVLKPGGRVLVLEFGQPTLFGFRHIYNFYSKHLMPLVGRMLTGNGDAYKYLPETSKAYPAGSAFLQLLEATGYKDRKLKSFFSGVAYAYVGSTNINAAALGDKENTLTSEVSIQNLETVNAN